MPSSHAHRTTLLFGLAPFALAAVSFGCNPNPGGGGGSGGTAGTSSTGGMTTGGTGTGGMATGGMTTGGSTTGGATTGGTGGMTTGGTGGVATGGTGGMATGGTGGMGGSGTGGMGGSGGAATGALDWVKTFPDQSGLSLEYPNGTVDAQGNVYLSVSFNYPHDFGDGMPIDAILGSKDAVVVKYDKTGAFVWKKVLATQGWDLIQSIHTDKNGNILLAGTVSAALTLGAVTIGPGWYVLELDPAGNAIWGNTAGACQSCDTSYLATDAQGNAFVGGVAGGVVWDGVALGAGQPGLGFWVGKFAAATGTLQWGRVTKASSNFGAKLDGLAVDATGGVVLTGTFGGASLGLSADASVPVDIVNPSPLIETPAFLARYDANGAFSAGKALGTFSGAQTGLVPQGLGIGADGYARVAGWITGTVTFPSGVYTSAKAALLLVHDETVGPGQTSKAFQQGADYSTPRALGIDGHDDSVVWGWYSGAWDPGNGPLPASKATFLTKLDKDDKVVWAQGYDLKGGEIKHMAVGKLEDETVLVGTYTGPFDLSPDQSLALGVFVARVKK